MFLIGAPLTGAVRMAVVDRCPLFPGMKFDTKISPRTLYRYVDMGLIPHVSNMDLPHKRNKKDKKKTEKPRAARSAKGIRMAVVDRCPLFPRVEARSLHTLHIRKLGTVVDGKKTEKPRAARSAKGKSIEERPKAVNSRDTYFELYPGYSTHSL